MQKSYGTGVCVHLAIMKCYFLACLVVSNVTGEAELRLDLPDSITTWVTEAIGLSAEKGLGLAQTAELRTFKPFFIDFTLPYSVIRGEQTKVPLTVYNYLPTCAEVCVFIYFGESWLIFV